MGLLLFAYHVLITCFPCPDNFLKIGYMPKTDSKLRGEPFWGRCLKSDYATPQKYGGRYQKERAPFCPRNPGQEISEQGSKIEPTNRPSHMRFILSHAFGAQKRAPKALHLSGWTRFSYPRRVISRTVRKAILLPRERLGVSDYAQGTCGYDQT